MFDSKAGTPLEGFAEFATAAAAEGAVLLRNDRGMLPLNPLQPVSLFGRTQIDYYRSGTGSGGAVNVVSRTTLLQAMRERSGGRLNEQLAALYESWIEQHPFDNGGGGWAAEPWYQQEMSRFVRPAPSRPRRLLSSVVPRAKIRIMPMLKAGTGSRPMRSTCYTRYAESLMKWQSC